MIHYLYWASATTKSPHFCKESGNSGKDNWVWVPRMARAITYARTRTPFHLLVNAQTTKMKGRKIGFRRKANVMDHTQASSRKDKPPCRLPKAIINAHSDTLRAVNCPVRCDNSNLVPASSTNVERSGFRLSLRTHACI